MGHVMSGLCGKMNRTKPLPVDALETPLKRCLNTFDITLLGKQSIELKYEFYYFPLQVKILNITFAVQASVIW